MDRFGEEFIVYRYTDCHTGRVVYIGKTNCSLKDRVNAHKREEGFERYDCIVDFVWLRNQVETDFVEKLLINYYKPVLNVKDKVDGLTDGLSVPSLTFVSYDEYLCLKASGGNKKLLYEEASKQTGLLMAAYEGCGSVSFPFVVNPVVCGKILTKKESELKGSRYTYRVTDEATEYTQSHFNEMALSIWSPYLCVVARDLSDSQKEALGKGLLMKELCKELKEFSWNGFVMEGGYEPYCLWIDKKYESIAGHFASFFGVDLREWDSKFTCDFGRDEAEKIDEYRECAYGEMLRFYQANYGICDMKKLEREGYLFGTDTDCIR